MNQKSSNFDEENNLIETKTRPKISKSSPSGGMIEQKILFDTPSLESNFSVYNVVSPGLGSSEAALKFTNPSLYAMNKKNKVPSGSILKSPNKSSSSLGKNSITQGLTSLLTKKPLSDLPNPNSALLEANQKDIENEVLSLQFSEDPVAYFSKRKDGRGHLFIYMKYAKDPSDPMFSPYDLTKVPHSDAGKDYYTMSANGVTHVTPSGFTEHITLDRWAKEESIYKSIRKLKTFQYYLVWKPFRVWKNFITQQHYLETLSKILLYPVFYNPSFASASVAIASLVEESDRIVGDYLLTFSPTKKYHLKQFLEITQDNLESLQKEYSQFINNLALLTNEVYYMLSDPDLLNVSDMEFAEIRRKNPNIGQLIILERKKDTEMKRRTELMKKETRYMSNFLRLFDYIMLEALRSQSFSKWKDAQHSICQEQSAVFQVEVYFSNDGKVSFSPSRDDLIFEVKKVFEKSLKTLDHLPRLLRHPDLRKILSECSYNLSDLFTNGPTFANISKSSPMIEEIETNVINTLDKSYSEAEQHSHVFNEFYPLYKLGQSWDVKDYIIKMDGNKYEGPLSLVQRPTDESEDTFLLHPENEPYVDFAKVKQDIEKLHLEKLRVKDIRAGVVRGALYVDSRQLRLDLAPIPTTSLHQIHETFTELLQYKINLMNRAFKSYTLKLKTEPNNLESFVDFCEILQRSIEIQPQISTEIRFVDNMIILFENAEFQHLQNPLHAQLRQFQSQQQSAQIVKTAQEEKFLFVLRQLVKQKERKLLKYRELSSQVPISTKGLDLDTYLLQTLRLKKKVSILEQTLKDCIRYQDILSLKITEFTELKDVVNNIEFSEKLYYLIRDWNDIENRMVSVQFAHLSINDFSKQISDLRQNLLQMKQMWTKPSPILSEVSVSFSEISPFITQLDQLSRGRMQIRHWNLLFEECGQANNYHPQITIRELIDLNILHESKKIEEITIRSHGESQIENEFQAMLSHWSEINLPIIENPQSNNICLGNVDMLLQDINDSSFVLNRMLGNKFVQGIKESITELLSTLDRIHSVLQLWQVFQSNWSILSSLFRQQSVSQSLPIQTNRFNHISQKWETIVDHVKSNGKIINVCAFKSIIEDFQEINNTIQEIMSSLHSYLDIKRQSIPRFFYLSDSELLTIISTADISTFSYYFCKTLMYINRIDSQSNNANESIEEKDEQEISNFVGLRIFGVAGEDGEMLPFADSITCSVAMDIWVPQFYLMMKSSMKDAMSISLSRIASTTLNDWMMTVSSYVAIVTLNIIFVRDIEDCFNNLETNPRAFLQYENGLKQRIHELITTMATPLSPNELHKVSSILTLLLNQYERAHGFIEKIPYFSHRIYWDNLLKFKYDASSMGIYIHYRTESWEHGLEFWGNASPAISTPSSDLVIQNLCHSYTHDSIPLLFGPKGSGKTEMIKDFACQMGRFLFLAPSFTDLSTSIISRLFIGAASSGTWLHLSNIHLLKHDNISYIFDAMRLLHNSRVSGNPKFKLDDYSVEIKNHCRIFLSTNIDTINSCTKIPPQLRSFTRPLAVSCPSIKKIIEIKLLSYGFKSAKIISNKMETCINSVIRIFSLSKSQMGFFLLISKRAQEILRFLMHSNKVEFINYYEDFSLAEEFAVSRASYSCLRSHIRQNDYATLIQIIRSSFPIFDSMEVFANNLSRHLSYGNDQIVEAIAKSLKSDVSYIEMELPLDYLISKTCDLFLLMQQYKSVIIVGEPNSGKSTIVDMLSKAISSIVSNVELFSILKGIMPLIVSTVYHGSNTWEDIFGSVLLDVSNSSVWNYGLLHNEINWLNQHEKSHHRILRFDGKMAPDFSKFFYQMVCDSNLIKLSNLETYSSNSFHVLLETCSLENLTPELKSVSGIIYMENIQMNKNNISSKIRNELFHPSILYSRAIRSHKHGFDDQTTDLIKSAFCDIAPRFVMICNDFPKVFDFQCSFESALSFCAKIVLSQIIDKKIDITNPIGIRNLITSIMFQVVTGIIHYDQYDNLSNRICDEFRLNFPSNWDNYIIPEIFSSFYPKPTLLTMRLSNDSFLPVDMSLLSCRPILRPGPSGGAPLFLDDVAIPVPQLILPAELLKMALKLKRHVILHGVEYSGRSSLIDLVISQFNDYQQIGIDCSHGISVSTFMRIIQVQTDILSKSSFIHRSKKTIVFVFSNLSKTSDSLIEFLRMIITTGIIPLFSGNDPKRLERISINNFVIIVKNSNVNYLSSRFVSQFVPIQTAPYNSNTSSYIWRKILNIYGVQSDVVDLVLSVCDTVICNPSISPKLLAAIGHSPKPQNEDDQWKFSIFRVIATYVFSSMKFDSVSGVEKVFSLLEPVCKNTSFESICGSFHRDKIFAQTIINFQNKTCSYRSETEFITLSQIKLNIEQITTYPVSPITLSNFLLIDNHITRPSGHCIISCNGLGGRVSLVKMVCEYRHYECNDLRYYSEDISDNLKRIISSAITKTQVQIILIKPSQENSEIINKISSIFVELNILSLYSFSEFLILIKLFYEKEEINDMDIQDSITQIKHVIRCLCRVVIIPDHEFVSTGFSQIYLTEPTKTLICESLLPEKAHQVIPFLNEVSTYVEENSIGCSLNQFYEFIELFSQFSTGDMGKVLNKNHNVSIVLDFIKRLRFDNEELDKKLEESKPDLEDMRRETDSLKGAYRMKHEAIEIRRMKLNEESMHRTRELQNLKKELDDSDHDLSSYSIEIERLYDEIAKLKESDVSPVRITAQSPPASVKLIFEALSLLLGEQPDFGKNGIRLLMEPGLPQKIHDGISYKTIDSGVVSQLQTYVSSPYMMKKELESIAPILLILKRFIDGLYEFGRRHDIVKQNRLAYEIESRSYSSFTDDMKREIESMEGIESQFDGEAKQLNQLISKLSELESVSDTYHQQKIDIEELLKGSDLLEDHWMKEIEQFSQNSGDTMLGDAAFLSIYIAYLGQHDNEKKEEMLARVHDTLINYKIQSSFRNPLNDIRNRLITTDMSIIGDSFLPKCALIDIQQMCSINRIPLLIDPDRIITDILINGPQSSAVSVLSNNFESSLSILSESEGFLVILDVDNVSYNIIRCYETIKELQYSKRIAKRVVFHTNHISIDSINPNMFQYCSPIDFSESSIEVQKMKITRSLMGFFDNELTKRISEGEKTDVNHQMQTSKHEIDTLESLVKIAEVAGTNASFDYLNEKQLIDFHKISKELFFSSLTGSVINQNDRSNADFLETILSPLVKVFQTFWICISRYLPKVNSIYSFQFSQFERVIEGFLISYGTKRIPLPEEIVKLKTESINSVFHWVFSALHQKDIMFFLFISVFTIQDGDWTELESIIENISKFNYNSSYTGLTENHYLQNLKSCSASEFFSNIVNYITNHFGEEVFTSLPFYQNDNIVSTSNTIPTLILSDPLNDPTTSITNFVMNRARLDSFENITLTESNRCLNEIMKTFSYCMNRGYWLLVHYTKPSQKCAQYINQMIENLTFNPMNSNFRLILNCHTTYGLSTRAFYLSKKVIIERFPSMKSSMSSLFYHNNSQIRSQYHLKTLKRLFYLGATAMSLIRYRMFVEPVGFNSLKSISSLSFVEFIEYIRLYLDTHGSEIEFRNLRDYIQDIAFGSRIIDTQDRRRLRAILASVFSHKSLDDGFSFLDHESPEFEKWVFPSDGPLNQLQQIMSSIPPYPSTEILLMHNLSSKTILNLCLCKHFSSPFLLIKNPPHYSDSEKKIAVDSLRAMLPSQISLKDPLKNTPMALFWKQECKLFNGLLNRIENDIQEETIIQSILQNNIPKSWGSVYDKVHEFFDYIIHKKEYLEKHISMTIPKEVDLKYIENIRNFFVTYKTQSCINFGFDESYTFSFSFEASDGLRIDSVYLVQGEIADSKLILPKNESFINKIPSLYMKLTAKIQKIGNTYHCPLYHTLFYTDSLPAPLSEFYEGESENYIMDIPLSTDKSDRIWLLNGTYLVAHVQNLD